MKNYYVSVRRFIQGHHRATIQLGPFRSWIGARFAVWLETFGDIGDARAQRAEIKS